ncbi:MAG: arylamine N-acetyltransferase [Alphaproteobacteria bacterium]|nr:arylamine N-acetyltransferase [Alphaproteobacteria bacterium]
MRLAALDNRRVDAYLARLGSPDVRHDAAGLARLQAAHLMAVPFHNLLLLANDGRPWGLQALHEVVDEAIAGVGGNCDRTTPPFTALLQAVGFDARLAATTVREPGDHFVAVVHADGGRFLCDVGNGHPYLRPWDLDGPVQEQSFQGWRFRFEPRAPGGPTLLRAMPDGALKTVYVVDPAPRAYDDFAPMVTAHYTQAGFGPFLSGLRAVAIQPDAVLTLRDAEYARDTRFGRSVRRVAGRDAVRALLAERFALPPRLVDEALEVVGRRRPELFGEPRWFALGRGHARESVGLEPPAREDVPDVLVSLATVGRGASVRRLLDTLAEEVRASHYPGRVGVLLVANHDRAEGAPEPDPDGIFVHRVAIEDLRRALDRAAEAGVLPPVGDRLPVPIGAARDAQIAALRAHLATPVGGLPHPSAHPIVVWMVDDDLAFQQLDPHGRIGRHTNLLFRAARFWSHLPQHAVVLGTFTGDPPVPGLDSLGGQLHDLAENVSRMLVLGPDADWQPPAAPPPTFDAYYDLTEAQAPHADAVWPYAPQRAGARVRDVALDLLRDLPHLIDGQQLTRPLVWDGTDAAPRPSLRRGGNALFLDLDALFRWPTPVLATPDGVTTRRADTVWAALAQAEEPGAVVEATLPLLHRRKGQAARPGYVAAHQAAHHTAAQVRGVVLARAVAEARTVAHELPAREARVTAQRRELRARLADLRQQVLALTAWSDPDLDLAVADGLEALDTLDRLAAAGEPMPGDPGEIDAFLARLPDAVRAWRGGW